MQASASAVLPPVSTILSQLNSLHSNLNEAKAADASESGTNSSLKNLYEEIKQQDYEKILNGDEESGWGPEIAAEIRCHPSASRCSEGHPHGVYPVFLSADISLFSKFLRLIREGELQIISWPCAILFHSFVPPARASSALPAFINLWLRNILV
jgi:hypothetical protein